MDDIRIILKPTVWGLVILMFFLPFTKLSCTYNRDLGVTLTGVEIAFGTEIKSPEAYLYWDNTGALKSRKTNPELLMISIFVISLISFFIMFLKSKISDCIMAINSFICVVLMLISKNKFEKEALREGQGLFKLEFMPAFWIALALFVLGIIIGAIFYLLAEKKK